MSEKIGLARAEIVDLLSLILRTHSRDELFSLFRSAEGITPKEDPEAWREANRKRQAAGVKFERRWGDGTWNFYSGDTFVGVKKDYREVPQYEMQIEQPAIGVIYKWDRVLTEKEISDLFSGKLRPEDIPQEVQKEGDMRIPEASREVLKQWQAKGLKFNVDRVENICELLWDFKSPCHRYTIPKQPIPEGVTVEQAQAMWEQGLRLEFNNNFGWDLAADGFDWNGIYRGAQLLARLRIPAQPIPEKLLDVPQDVSASECQKAALEHLAKTYSADKGTAQLNPPAPHAAERALWKVQREAGTNEIWQVLSGNGVADIRVDVEPNWHPDFIYRVKPMKLTAKIIRRGVYKTSYYWEFTGTREEYRAECEKYGYVVISEIKEVKTTVTYYFALYKMTIGDLNTIYGIDKEWILDWTDRCGHTIIGDIEEREIEA